MRLIALSIHPLFVFDGPHKPPFKRNKRTGPNIASIPEFLAKQLLKQFGLPFHLAPGEAEAECALLQQRGVVDAVLSEDVDTLMFGSGLTLRNWSPEGTLKTRTFTHVNLYDARKTKEGRSGLDRNGMILVALMSGGDYLPEGIPGCGAKTACEAARAGFGKELCTLGRKDHLGISVWKEKLCYELRTNESKLFRQKHKALTVPDDFPRPDVLKYYVHPVVSTHEKVENLRDMLRWDLDIDISALRSFVGDAFDWVCLSGAKKFVRNLAPALLLKNLRLRAEEENNRSDDPHEIAKKEAKLIKNIYMRRQHISTDKINELRIGFVPLDIVPVDLAAEEPDPELPVNGSDSEDEALSAVDDQELSLLSQEPRSPHKKRTPSEFDPTRVEKIWVMETFVRVGVPLKTQDWEESFRDAKKYEAAKTIRKLNERKTKKAPSAGMAKGALDRFTRVTKPGSTGGRGYSKSITPDSVSTSQPTSTAFPIRDKEMYSLDNAADEAFSIQSKDRPPRAIFQLPKILPDSPPQASQESIICLLSSSPPRDAVPTKRALHCAHSDTSATAPGCELEDFRAIDEIDVTQSVTVRRSKKKTPEVRETSSSRSRAQKYTPLRRTATVPSCIFELDEKEEQEENDVFDLPPAKRPNLFSSSSNASFPHDLPTNEDATCSPYPSKGDGQDPSTPHRSEPSMRVITISSSPPQLAPGPGPAPEQPMQPLTPTSVSQQLDIKRYLKPAKPFQHHLPQITNTPSPSRPAPALAASTTPPRSISAKKSRPACDLKYSTEAQAQAQAQAGEQHVSTSASSSADSPRHRVHFDFGSGGSQGAPSKQRQLCKRRVRLRESLEGAFAICEDDDVLAADRTEEVEGGFLRESFDAGNRMCGKEPSAADMRSGKKRERARGREWRMSQVEVLDLTSLG